jgi:hypothetical protein
MVGGVAGLTTLALGSSAKTVATIARQATERLSVTTILSIAAIVFVLALTIVLSKLGRLGLDHAAVALGAAEDSAVKAGIAIVASIVLGGVAALTSYWVNVNRVFATRGLSQPAD